MSNLGDSQASNGETRDDIRPEKPNIVLRTPLENWEEELKTQNEFPEPSLVFEFVKWVIWEEDLRKPVLEFVEGGLLWWQANLVNLRRRHCLCWCWDSDGGFMACKVFNSV